MRSLTDEEEACLVDVSGPSVCGSCSYYLEDDVSDRLITRGLIVEQDGRCSTCGEVGSGYCFLTPLGKLAIELHRTAKLLSA